MAEKYVSVYKSPTARAQLLEYYDRVLRNWPIPYEEQLVETPCGLTHLLLCGNPAARPPSGSFRDCHPRSIPMSNPMARATLRRWKSSRVSIGIS